MLLATQEVLFLLYFGPFLLGFFGLLAEALVCMGSYRLPLPAASTGWQMHDVSWGDLTVPFPALRVMVSCVSVSNGIS